MATKREILAGCSKEVTSSKLIARNTVRIEYADGTKAIRFHQTDVITELANGNCIFSSGGWRTSTTKERLNEFGKAIRVHQVKGIWYINGYTFYDGITFDAAGQLASKDKAVDTKKVDAVKRKIAKFVGQLTRENLPMPEAGDCFICRMPGLGDCVSSHMKENYLHGSLLVAAMRARGYSDDSIRLHYSMKLVDTFKRALRVYVQRAIMPEVATS